MATSAASPPQHPRVPGRGVDGEIRDQRTQGRDGWVRSGGQGRLEERIPQRETGDNATTSLSYVISSYSLRGCKMSAAHG
jgi:hypothetical protein